MAGARPASRLKTASRKQTQKIGGKGRGENDENGANGNEGKLDEALLKKPIETSVVGLTKVLQVLQNGTSEVQDYLSNECDIVYECRVCRSLFRSLANFILHKRLYCQDLYENTLNYNRKFQDEEQLYVQSENDLRQDDDEMQEIEKKSKDLSSIIERLGKKIDNTFQINNNKLSECPVSDEDEVKNVLSLQNMDGTMSGMFQTISENSTTQDAEFMKNEIMELHMMENGGAVIGPDGRCLGFRSSSRSPNPSLSTVKKDFVNESIRDGKIECVKCNQKFSTKKTLRFHINTKHNENRLVYPCPDCSETFVNPWGVYRHLFKAHRKTSNEVRKLRDVVQNSCYQVDQAPVHKKVRLDPVLEVPILTEQEQLNEKNKEWMENLESDNDLQCCGGCGRRFERKAALHSHSLMCQKRIALCNKIKRTSDDKSTMKTKSTVKKNVVTKKKTNDELSLDKNNYEFSSMDESRPPSSEIENPESIIIDTAIRKNSNDDQQALKLILSDDDDSLEEVPVKDPLGVSDNEECSSIAETTALNNEITKEDNPSQEKNKLSLVTPSVNQTTEKCTNEGDSSTELNKTFVPMFVNDMLAARMKAFTNVGRKFVCMPCDYRYSSLASLRRHMAVHFNWKRFRCMRCDFMSFDKRDAIVHAQTLHHATLDVIKKFVVRMTETESDHHSSKIFLPLNTTPQEIITLDDSDEDSNKHDQQLDQQLEEMKDSQSSINNSESSSDENNTQQNDFSRNLIMEMIIGVSEPSQKINISSSSLESKCSDPLEDIQTITTTATISPSTDPIVTTVGNITITNISNNSISSISNNSTSSISEETSKVTNVTTTSISSSRPVRNRVKPVDKDFIYDMSALTRDDVDDIFYVSTKSKRKTETDTTKDAECYKFATIIDDTTGLKKKRRRNSKIYINSSNSNSSSEINDPIRIVPIEYSQTTNCLTKMENNDDDKNERMEGSSSNDEQNSKTVVSEESPSPFLIHSVMSVNM